jgi:hypothetical protein
MPKFTINDPEIAALLHDVRRCSGQTYYKINPETGEHYVYAIRKNLMNLGMSAKTATQVLKSADIPLIPFIRNEPPGPEKPEPSEAEIMAAIAASAAAAAKEAAKEAKKAAAEERANNRRWQYIETSSGKCGVYDNDNATVIGLYYTRQEAIDELPRLRAGSSQVGVYNYRSRKSRQPDLQEIHY